MKRLFPALALVVWVLLVVGGVVVFFLMNYLLVVFQVQSGGCL